MKANKIIWIIAMFLLAAALVNAGSYNPETYWGYAYIEGTLVPAGTALTLESANTGEIFANQTVPYDINYPGSYSVILEFDDAYTPADEGADLNENLTWKVNGVAAAAPEPGADIAETGKTNNNFRIDAIINPAITAAIQQSATSLYLGQSMNLTVILNNTGAGSGNATLMSVSGNLTSDLPKTVYVARNNANQSIVSITPSVCGQQTPTLTVNYYNLAGTLVASLSNQFSLNVTGADLVLDNIAVSNSSLVAGNTVSITSRVNNSGTTNITGFTARFYHNSTLIDTITSNEALSAGQSIGISANWVAVEGTHTISINISTAGTECYTTNNGKTTNVVVSAAPAQTTTSSGGGGAGGGGTAGISSNTECNDTIDNDGDGLIDYPQDLGCESLNDDNETDEAQQISGGGTEEIKEKEANETIEGIEPPAQEEPKKTGGFMPLFTGFVAAVRENNVDWLLILIVIILSLALTYKLLSGVKREEIKKQPGQEQHRIRIDIHPKKEIFNIQNSIQKREKQTIYNGKPAEIQKSIKISSKKEILDKLKEVYEENG